MHLLNIFRMPKPDVWFIHAIAVALIVSAIVAYSGARFLRNRYEPDVLAVIPGILAGLAIAWLFILLPFIFEIQGEWLLLTIPVGLLISPLFLFIGHKFSVRLLSR